MVAGPQRGTQRQRSGACREPRRRGRAEAVPWQPKQRPGPARQPLRPRPAATFPSAAARRGLLGARGGYGDLPRSRCCRHEAPRTAAETDGGPGGAGGGANAGGAARAAAPSPAARLGVQVASGANHREGCGRGGYADRARPGPAGPYHAMQREGSTPGLGAAVLPPAGRARHCCGVTARARSASRALTSPGPATLPGPWDRLSGLLEGMGRGLLPGWVLRSSKAKLQERSAAKCGLQHGQSWLRFLRGP